MEDIFFLNISYSIGNLLPMQISRTKFIYQLDILLTE